MSGRRERVVVVGGGVIGAFSAYYLQQAGWSVTILDKGRFGAGCSHANCGFVCPSHVFPLAAPGAVGSALKTMLSRDAPLRVKPRFDPALWAWLYHFRRRCNQRDMLSAGAAIKDLLDSSRELYDGLFSAEPLEAEWQTLGLLAVFQTKQALDRQAAIVDLLQRDFGLSAHRYDGAAIRQLEPALKPGLAGGFHFPRDAHLRPDRLLDSLRRLLVSRGATLIEDCPFTALHCEGAKAVAVETPRGDIDADAFVIAAGAWTPTLNARFGCRIPIQPGKGYSLTMPPPENAPRLPLLFEEHRVAVTPMKSGYRLGSIMELGGYDESLSERRLRLLVAGAGHYLDHPTAEPVLEKWFGWRPMTYDGLPIIGPTPAVNNAYLAAGHNMLGLSMAPGTGKLVAELITGRPPHIDPFPYRPTRF